MDAEGFSTFLASSSNTIRAFSFYKGTFELRSADVAIEPYLNDNAVHQVTININGITAHSGVCIDY